jgi:hypothetical protein
VLHLLWFVCNSWFKTESALIQVCTVHNGRQHTSRSSNESGNRKLIKNFYGRLHTTHACNLTISWMKLSHKKTRVQMGKKNINGEDYKDCRKRCKRHRMRGDIHSKQVSILDPSHTYKVHILLVHTACLHPYLLQHVRWTTTLILILSSVNLFLVVFCIHLLQIYT